VRLVQRIADGDRLRFGGVTPEVLPEGHLQTVDVVHLRWWAFCGRHDGRVLGVEVFGQVELQLQTPVMAGRDLGHHSIGVQEDHRVVRIAEQLNAGREHAKARSRVHSGRFCPLRQGLAHGGSGGSR
jgi:hypothetical protein